MLFRVLRAVLPAAMAVALTACAGSSGEGGGASSSVPTTTSASVRPSAPESVSASPSMSPSLSPDSSLDPSPDPSPSASSSLSSGHESFPPAPAEESEEVAAIREGWEEYEREDDRFRKDSSLSDFSSLVQTTTGVRTERAISSIRSWREAGVIRVGDLSFRDLAIEAPRQGASGEWQARLTVCKDFTKQQRVVEATGKEYRVEGKENVATMRGHYTMQRTDDGRWVVADVEGQAEPC